MKTSSLNWLPGNGTFLESFHLCEIYVFCEFDRRQNGTFRIIAEISTFHFCKQIKSETLPCRFLDENVMVAAQEIFIAHDWVYTKGNYHCAESVICSLNEHSLTLNPINTKVGTHSNAHTQRQTILSP